MPHPESEAPDSSGPPPGETAREEPRITDPPAALWSRNPLAWFRFFGPGAIVASVTVGSGEIVRPDWPAALEGFPIPHALQYPEWAFQVVPKLSQRSEWVEVPVYDLAIFLAFFGILLGGPENAVSA